MTAARDDLMTVEEVADALQVRPSTVRRWHRTNRIPCRRLTHSTIRYCLADVVRALEASQPQTGPTPTREPAR